MNIYIGAPSENVYRCKIRLCLFFRTYAKDVALGLTTEFTKPISKAITQPAYVDENESENDTESDVPTQAADPSVFNSIATWLWSEA